jgi:hypothetical protein
VAYQKCLYAFNICDIKCYLHVNCVILSLARKCSQPTVDLSKCILYNGCVDDLEQIVEKKHPRHQWILYLIKFISNIHDSILKSAPPTNSKKELSYGNLPSFLLGYPSKINLAANETYILYVCIVCSYLIAIQHFYLWQAFIY